jgi:hypothetical protein
MVATQFKVWQSHGQLFSVEIKVEIITGQHKTIIVKYIHTYHRYHSSSPFILLAATVNLIELAFPLTL